MTIILEKTLQLQTIEEDTGNDEENDEEDENSDNEDDNEEFNIDTSLDDENQDDNNSDSSDTSSSSSSTSTDDTEDEPVEANTDIFSNMSAEQQATKIKELKNLFRNLYTSCDDMITKINNIDPDEDNLEVLSRVSLTMYNLKQYIKDYMVNFYNSASYIENDIMFNRFLAILNSTSTIVNDLGKAKNREKDKDKK